VGSLCQAEAPVATGRHSPQRATAYNCSNTIRHIFCVNPGSVRKNLPLGLAPAVALLAAGAHAAAWSQRPTLERAAKALGMHHDDPCYRDHRARSYLSHPDAPGSVKGAYDLYRAANALFDLNPSILCAGCRTAPQGGRGAAKRSVHAGSDAGVEGNVR